MRTNKRTIASIKQENKNIAKVANSLLESFIMKNNAVSLKVLMYIAKSAMPAEQIAELPNDKIIKITIKTRKFIDYFQMDIKTLKRNIKLLSETSINYKNETGEGYINILPKAHFDYDGNLEIQMYSEILKLTHSLNKYSIIDVSQMARLESKHSLRMLMLLERINNFIDNAAKRQSYELDELNLMFGTQYKKLTEFERRVLAPAKKDLDSNSKLSFVYSVNKDKITRSVGRAKSLSVTIDLVRAATAQPSLLS